MFDTDNDGLEDGEEVIAGEDNFLTHANNSDTDADGLIDGHEVLFVPRPFQRATNPLLNDTDSDGMLDGWEMQGYLQFPFCMLLSILLGSVFWFYSSLVALLFSCCLLCLPSPAYIVCTLYFPLLLYLRTSLSTAG